VVCYVGGIIGRVVQYITDAVVICREIDALLLPGIQCSCCLPPRVFDNHHRSIYSNSSTEALVVFSCDFDTEECRGGGVRLHHAVRPRTVWERQGDRVLVIETVRRLHVW